MEFQLHPMEHPFQVHVLYSISYSDTYICSTVFFVDFLLVRLCKILSSSSHNAFDRFAQSLFTIRDVCIVSLKLRWDVLKLWMNCRLFETYRAITDNLCKNEALQRYFFRKFQEDLKLSVSHFFSLFFFKNYEDQKFRYKILNYQLSTLKSLF